MYALLKRCFFTTLRRLSFTQARKELAHIDPAIMKKVDTLVDDGVKTTSELKRHVRAYVTRELCADIDPDYIKGNRRFEPEGRALYGRMKRYEANKK